MPSGTTVSALICTISILSLTVSEVPSQTKVTVKGGVFHNEAHADQAAVRGEGDYIGSVRVAIVHGGSADLIVEVGVYAKSVADEIAAGLFRSHSLSFDPANYMPVQNTINALIRGEEGPSDLSISRAQEQGFSGPHPFLVTADANKGVFLKLPVSLEGGSLDVVVMEGERAEPALDRALGEREGNLDAPSAGERERMVREIEAEMFQQLTLEQDVLLRRLGDGPAWGDDAVLTAPLDAVPGDGKDASAVRDEREMQRQLHGMQHPATCRDRRALVYSFDRSIVGLAVNIHYITLLLNYCWYHNRTLIMADPDHWNYAGKSCTRGWGCYFEPLSNCSEGLVWQPYTLDIRNDAKIDYRGYVYPVDTSHGRVLSFANVDGPWLELVNQDMYRNFIPKEFAHRGHLWWRSQLARFVFRPKPFVLEYTEQRKEAMGWVSGGSSVVVGMHVRHGDKSWDVAHQGAYLGGLTKYVDKAEKLLSSLEAPRVSYFISTDDISVLSEARNLDAHRVFWDDAEPRYNGTHVYSPPGVSEKRWPGFPGNDENVDTFRYALDSIKSILLLVRSDVFVGTTTSCFSRLVYQLRAAGAAGGLLGLGDEWTVDSDPRYSSKGWPGWIMDP